MADITTYLGQFLYSRLPQISGGSGSASGVLTVNTTSAGTAADTNETTLWTYDLPASTLSADGRAVRITAFGTLANNADLKSFRLYFGSTITASIISTGQANVGWILSSVVFRTSATAQLASSDSSVGTSKSIGLALTPAETLASAVTIKVTGQNGTAAANDIVFKGALVEILN